MVTEVAPKITQIPGTFMQVRGSRPTSSTPVTLALTR